MSDAQSQAHDEPQVKKTVIIVLILAVLVIAAGYIYQSLNTNTEQHTEQSVELYNPVLYAEQTTPISEPVALKADKHVDLGTLKETIQSVIEERTANTKWIIGVVVTDLKSGQSVGINEQESFDAASIGKIPILLTIYEQISKGEIKDSDEITIKASEIQDYGTGILRYQKAPMTLTVKELSELMIKKSDNTAAYVLATKANRTKIKEFVAKLEMTNTDPIENTTTPADTDVSLRYIYNLQKTDPALAGTITKIMTDSDFEQRLPAQLPEDTIVAHKIGTGVAQIHDAGIVLNENRPYAISVLTKKVNDEKKAEELIAEISKATYDFFAKLN